MMTALAGARRRTCTMLTAKYSTGNLSPNVALAFFPKDAQFGAAQFCYMVERLDDSINGAGIGHDSACWMRVGTRGGTR